MTRQRVVSILVIASWLILWHVAWSWLTPLRPVTRIELPRTASLLSVSDTGLVSVSKDSAAPLALQRSMAKVWDIKTGQERALPFRPGDVQLGYGLSYQVPCFVFRDGCVHQIDAITGDTLQRYEELRSAVHVQASPDRSHLLVERVPMEFDLFDLTSRKVTWTTTRTEPTQWHWTNGDFLSHYEASEKRYVFVDASTGQTLKGEYAGYPFRIAKSDGRILAFDLFGANALRIVDVQSNQVLLKVPFIHSGIGFPDKKQLRISADGSSLLLDYVDKSGRVATENWKLSERESPRSVSFSPFKVAANGSVIKSRVVEHPEWLSILQKIGRYLRGASLEEPVHSTVFDHTGKQLLQVTHTYWDINYVEEFAAFTDRGQGLVVINNGGIEFYRVPPHGPVWFPYWLGLLVPSLAWWVTRQRRRQPPQPVASTA